MTKSIKLVLSGSGFLYPCHAGAIIRLAEAGYEFEEICGVSGGAVIAAALASGYKPNTELVKLIKQTLPAKNKIIDFSLFSLFQNWGLVKGDKIEKMFEKYFAKKLADAKLPLYIVSTDVNRQEKRIFSSATDPSMSMAKAVRASMAIPFVFAPLDWGGEKYVDGGWISNFPLDIFGDADNVIGIHFKSKSHQFNRIKSIKDYIMGLIDTAIASNAEEDILDASRADRITVASKHGHLNFNTVDSDVDVMVQEGWLAADKYLKSLV